MSDAHVHSSGLLIDEVRLKWAALLEGGPTNAGTLTIQEFESSQLKTAVLGMDGTGIPHLLIAAGRDSPVPKLNTEGLHLAFRELIIEDGSDYWLDLSCPRSELFEVFEHFVVAVLQRLLAPPFDATNALFKTLEVWSQFFEQRKGALRVDELAPLFGELLALRDVLRESPAAGLDVWSGPAGGRHDLRNGPFAMEVKTTRAHTASTVTIHGTDQLEAPEGGELFLHFVRLELAAGGSGSVPQLIDEMVAAGHSRVALYTLIQESGLDPAQLPLAKDFRFDIRERQTFMVTDDFPKLTVSDFVRGDLPDGVVDVTYRLDLNAAGEPLNPPGVQSAFEKVGKGKNS